MHFCADLAGRGVWGAECGVRGLKGEQWYRRGRSHSTWGLGKKSFVFKMERCCSFYWDNSAFLVLAAEVGTSREMQVALVARVRSEGGPGEGWAEARSQRLV